MSLKNNLQGSYESKKQPAGQLWVLKTTCMAALSLKNNLQGSYEP